jgi:hypothetical protein
MIRVQAYCDVCRSSQDVVTSLDRLEATILTFGALHKPECKEETPDGQDQAEPGEAEAGAAGAKAEDTPTGVVH